MVSLKSLEKSIFQCDQCEIRFNSQESLKSHDKAQHRAHSYISSCIVLYLVSEYAYLPLYIWVSHGSRASDESGPIISESGKREELAVMYAG